MYDCNSLGADKGNQDFPLSLSNQCLCHRVEAEASAETPVKLAHRLFLSSVCADSVKVLTV